MATATKDFQLRVATPPMWILTEDLGYSIATEESVPLSRETGPDPSAVVEDNARAIAAHGSSLYLTTGGPLPPGDCPSTPTTLAAIDTTESPTWLAIDPTLQKFCVINENNSVIYFVNASFNTLSSTVDLGGGSGAPAIVFDSVNGQFVIMNYDGDIIFVDAFGESEISRISGLIHHPEHGLLAYDPVSGNCFATSYRDVTVTGNMYVISGSSRSVISTTHNSRAPDCITWCPNISKVHICGVGIGQPLYWLFDPVAHTFSNSGLSATTNFNYECIYDPIISKVLQSQDGAHPSRIINVVSDSIVATIDPQRISDAGFSTCNNETWVSNGNDKIFVLTGSNLTTKKIYSAKPNGICFFSQANLMWFTDYGTNQIITLPAAGPAYPADETDEMGYATFGDLGGVTAITFNNVISIPGFDIETNTELTSLQFPFLVYIDPNNLQSGYLFIDGIIHLAVVSMPVFMPTPGGSYSITNSALNAASVNAFLHRCVANPNFTSGTVDLSGGSNSPPTGAGLTDKATLISRGVSVTTN